jgi:hypothetical protein
MESSGSFFGFCLSFWKLSSARRGAVHMARVQALVDACFFLHHGAPNILCGHGLELKVYKWFQVSEKMP